MALNSVYFRVTKWGPKGSASLPTAASSDVIAGKGIMNYDGNAKLLSGITKFAGIACQTPGFDKENITYLRKGSEFYIKDDGSNTYWDSTSGTPQDGDPAYITKIGKITDQTTDVDSDATLQIGSFMLVVGAGEATVLLNFVAATAKAT